ncbi:USF [Acanthosepion pharaonis]|uniref:USF n=1 Tax=Acanthosepion pharaonis TaxID=158019 RepID=A0A812CSA4_ACAPH|nr:USF [Sepia pharaonis]
MAPIKISQDKTNDSNASDEVQLTGHAEGQVTYRVVQVTQDGSEATAQVVSTGFPPGSQVAQAVIQAPFSNGGSPTPDNQSETRFTYFPSASTGEGAVTSQADVSTATAIGPVTTAGGQFYVMMSPQDVLQGQRNIAPRTGFTPKLEGRSTRDDRRRATHNEVERRRRDKINNWIVHLSKLVPECSQDHNKQGQVNASKGGILAKACEYIQELRTANARMAESLKETERISVDCDLHRQQCEELKQENSILRATLQQHGIGVPDHTGGAS